MNPLAERSLRRFAMRRKRGENIERLKGLLGVKKTQALVWLFSGDHIWMPQKNTLSRAQRNDAIIDDYLSGMPVMALAKKYCLNESWVRRVIKRVKERNENGLFPTVEK